MSAGPQLRLRIDGVDETQYLRADRGVTITRGRSDAETLIGPGRVNLTLDNGSGRFTLGRPNSGGVVRVSGQLVELDAWDGTGWSRRFTGFVDSWPVTWDSGQVAVAQVSATDRLKRLAIASAGRGVSSPADAVDRLAIADCVTDLTHIPSAVWQVIDERPKSGSPAVLTRWQVSSGTRRRWYQRSPGQTTTKRWWYDEQTHAHLYEERVGANWPASVIPAVSGILTGEQHPALAQPSPYDTWAIGAYQWYPGLVVPQSNPGRPYAGMGSLAAMWIRVIDDGPGDARVLPAWASAGATAATWSVAEWQITGVWARPRAGRSVDPPTWTGPPMPLHPNAWHHLAVHLPTGTGGAVKFYLDGQLVGTSPAVAAVWASIGGRAVPTASAAGGMALAHGVAASWWPYAEGDALVPGWVDALCDAGPDGTEERSDLRIARALAQIGITPGPTVLLDPGRAILNASPGRKPVTDAINAAVTAEGGLWHVDRSGVLRFRHATHRWTVPAITLTVTAEQTEAPLSMDSDGDTSIANEITANNNIGDTVILNDEASQAIYGQRTATIAIPVDRMALHQTASETLARDAAERLRLRTVTLDVLTQPTLRQAACTLDISSLLTLTDIPPGADATRAAVWVEGITESIGTDTWTMQFATSPAQLGDTAVYDTSRFDAGRFGI